MSNFHATFLSLAILLAPTDGFATAIRYTVTDEMGNPAISDISVSNEVNGIYFIEMNLPEALIV